MTAPTDRVQLLKRESTALGGQDAEEQDWPVPLNPQEDAIEAMGVFFQDATYRDEQVYIARDGDTLVLRDVTNPTEVTLSALLTNVAIVPTAVGQLFFSADGIAFGAHTPLTVPEAGWLIDDDGILVVIG